MRGGLFGRKQNDFPVPAVTTAAPQYLAKRGTPQVPDDLRNHEAIIDLNMSDPYTWTYRAGSRQLSVRVNGRLHFGDPTSALRPHALASALHASRILSYRTICKAESSLDCWRNTNRRRQ